MDAITSAFSSLANAGDNGGGLAGFLKGIAPYAGLGTAGAGIIGNIQANQARNAVLDAEMKRMNAYNNLTPGQVGTQITQLEQPLSSDLVHSVGNQVQGNLAQRGLSQAPGIQAEALAQGLAPYQLQEQQMAQQALFQKLGLPIQAQPSPFGPYPQTSNQSQLFQALSRTFMNGPQGNSPSGFNYWAANNANPTVPTPNIPSTANPPDITSMINSFLGSGYGGDAGLVQGAQ